MKNENIWLPEMEALALKKHYQKLEEEFFKDNWGYWFLMGLVKVANEDKQNKEKENKEKENV